MKTKWNAIYVDKEINESLRIKIAENAIDEIFKNEEDIHDYNPFIDEIRNPVNNDRRK